MNIKGSISIAAVILTVMLTMVVKAARAHDGHLYDSDCCGNGDCEPVKDISFVASDPTALPVMVVTTSLGTKPITNQTKIRESKDGRMHGCIRHSGSVSKARSPSPSIKTPTAWLHPDPRPS
jgi:hypothetical protein